MKQMETLELQEPNTVVDVVRREIAQIDNLILLQQKKIELLEKILLELGVDVG